MGQASHWVVLKAMYLYFILKWGRQCNGNWQWISYYLSNKLAGTYSVTAQLRLYNVHEIQTKLYLSIHSRDLFPLRRRKNYMRRLEQVPLFL